MLTAAESLIAEQAAQSTALTFLMRAVLKMSEREGAREALIRVWDRRGGEILSETKFVGVADDRQATVREYAAAKFSDLIMTASKPA